MRLLLILCLLMVVHVGKAQDKREPVVKNVEWMKSGDENFRIITSDQTIGKGLMDTYPNVMVRFSGIKKKDRAGIYWEISYYFRNVDKDKVFNYLKSLK